MPPPVEFSPCARIRSCPETGLRLESWVMSIVPTPDGERFMCQLREIMTKVRERVLKTIRAIPPSKSSSLALPSGHGQKRPLLAPTSVPTAISNGATTWPSSHTPQATRPLPQLSALLLSAVVVGVAPAWRARTGRQSTSEAAPSTVRWPSRSSSRSPRTSTTRRATSSVPRPIAWGVPPEAPHHAPSRALARVRGSPCPNSNYAPQRTAPGSTRSSPVPLAPSVAPVPAAASQRQRASRG
mmetsp:Transcript_105602/g.340338  ORF Transcript_105602/g.340338 Transcript_105602/m.340338 type:complete len:241 (-) Transcript_105602:134-856(-)